jgi:Flp pilus assembly protein TadB
LRRLAAVVTGAVVLVLAFVFSMVVFAIALTVGALALGYVWWKTRALRRTQPQIIEAEIVEVRTEREERRQIER